MVSEDLSGCGGVSRPTRCHRQLQEAASYLPTVRPERRYRVPQELGNTITVALQILTAAAQQPGGLPAQWVHFAILLTATAHLQRHTHCKHATHSAANCK